nr:hypothetical protein [Tanacetum cinerariifolium]
MHIDGQSMEVDVPPDIMIDVFNEDDDNTDDEDALPHDLAESDNEDPLMLMKMMSADVARSHGCDGGGEDRPPPHQVPSGCMGCFANRGKGKRKPNLGSRAAGRLNTRNKTWNLSLKDIMDTRGLGGHSGCAFVLPFLAEGPKGAKGRAHHRYWEINAGIQQHLQKVYNTNKVAFKAQHWVIDHTNGTYNVEKIRRERPENITASE